MTTKIFSMWSARLKTSTSLTGNIPGEYLVMRSTRKNVGYFGNIRFHKKRGSRTPNFSGCHKAIATYQAFLAPVTEN